MYEPYLIAPFDSEGAGLVEYYKPWLIGNDAFPIIEDAYCWRGNVRKREGDILLGTLPTTPVQGLRTYLVPSTGDQQLIAFSKTKSYVFNTGTQAFDNVSFFQTSGAAISWTGGNDDFFWSSNFQNSMWATNFVDPLRFYNGSTTQGWNNQRPTLNGANLLLSCLMVIPYKGRLVVLNTTEGPIGAPVSFRQRARWSQIGTAYVPASGGDPAVVPPTGYSTDANAWRDDIPGRGGFIDADTSERIVSAGIVRDTLIVFFQRSTWRLRYTGNEILPFIWERINTQYGSEATFSTIPFDEALLTFSRFGFIAADTNSVARIDEKIPDQSFQIETGTTLANLNRIHGIRDFYRQTAYWAYPAENTSVYPDRVLDYNYLEKTWSRFNQSFRVFGYYNTFNDKTWANAGTNWEDSDFPWSSPWNQNQFPQIVAGDSSLNSGNIYIVYDNVNIDQDDVSFDITNITAANPAVVTTSTINTFVTGHSVLINNVTGTMAGSLNNTSFTITVLSQTTFSINFDTTALTYTGGGTATSTVPYNFNIYTKRFNPYIKLGTRAKLAYVDIYCTGNVNSQITLHHYIDDEDGFPTLTKTVNCSSTNQGQYVRVFLGSIGRFHQLQLTLSTSQLEDAEQGTAQFEMQGMLLWFRPEGRIKGGK
jgi:hypothetical protein